MKKTNDPGEKCSKTVYSKGNINDSCSWEILLNHTEKLKVKLWCNTIFHLCFDKDEKFDSSLILIL